MCTFMNTFRRTLKLLHEHKKSEQSQQHIIYGVKSNEARFITTI